MAIIRHFQSFTTSTILIMSKTIDLQVEKSRSLIEGYRSHLSELQGRGASADQLDRMEQNIQRLIAAGEECDRMRAALSEKVRDTNHWNIHLLSGYIHDVHEFFDDGEVDVIYLNFSDPWPKAKHAKRRLTHRDYLASYMDILSDRGYIEFKTDNDDLFEFTVEEAEAMGYTISEMTRDLAASDYESAGYRTEYEEKFIEQGIKIKYLKIEKCE